MEKRKARILIIGGGFGGLFTALELGAAGDVTLVNDDDHFVFAPLLYEYLSGEVEAWHIAPYFKDLLDDRIRFVRGSVTDVDFSRREAHISNRQGALGYDVLILAPGGVTNYWNIAGAAEYALPFRKIRHADELRRRMTLALDHMPPDSAPQDVREKLTFAVVGGGASGVELSTKMADLLNDAFQRRNLRGEPRVVVFEMSDEIVPGMGEEIRDYVTDALKDARVEIHTNTRVVEVKPNSIVYEHNGVQSELQTVAVVWTAGVKTSTLVERLDLEKDQRGLILVEPTMQASGRDEVFVLGDIARVEQLPPSLAGTAQLAFQEASLVAENIKSYLSGRPTRPGRFEELGEALSLGTENAAVLIGEKAIGCSLSRQALFAL
ncbi:MAG TPA: FAD-dependent oxidoreductase, partial [Pyrinomonadaceae bacterium]|nr:FAD-dependent oxidoreductase [Pyrinomonadaceae bacterium]